MSKKENSDFSYSTLSEVLNQTKVRLQFSVAVDKYSPVKSRKCTSERMSASMNNQLD